MNVNTESVGEDLVLSYALMVYSSRGYSNNAAFVTKHPVTLVGEKPVIRAGMPLTDKDYALFVKSIQKSNGTPIAWNNPNILCNSRERLIWWRPPAKQAMFYKVDNRACEAFEGNGVCPTPGLVFVATGGSLYIYAVKGKNKPTPDTPLYQAPFMNVWGTGQVCIGNASRPGEDRVTDLQAWERMFFGSRFTHPNFTEKDRLTKGIDPGKFWKKQITKPSANFPEGVLVNINRCAQDLFAIDFASKVRELRAQGEF